MGLARGRPEARRMSQVINLDGLQEDVQGATDKIGILCFSEDPLDMLMWGHYGEGHTGVCLQFSISATDQFFGRVQPVVYSVKRPIFDPDRSYGENAEAAVLTKSVGWMYEREWRILELYTGEGNYPFPSEKLTGLILGYRMEKKARDEVLELVAKGAPGIRIYEALPDERLRGLVKRQRTSAELEGGTFRFGFQTTLASRLHGLRENRPCVKP
jgi:hypothetical protein